LHLVRPLGFRIDDRSLRRAGLDYWDEVDLTVHASLKACLAAASTDRCWFFSKTATRRYDEVDYRPGDWLVFGSETHGLPDSVLETGGERLIGIPMVPGAVRSLNLASAASISLYEALRQNGFEGLGLEDPDE
jgi:tRNA (cytidine/uridine-2'-O-)-methyltransferase